MEAIEERPTPPLVSPARKTIGHPNKQWVIGFVILLISVVITAAPSEFFARGGMGAAFIAQYILAFVFFFVLTNSKEYQFKNGWKGEHVDSTILVFTLYSLSAFTLNKVIPIFGDLPVWTIVLTTFSFANLVSFQYFNKLPLWCNRVQGFILGVSIVYFTYCTLYLGPGYFLGFMGTIVFLIGLHIFLPLALLITSIKLIQSRVMKRISMGWVVAGAFISVLYIVGFVAEWVRRIEDVEIKTNRMVMIEKSDFPAWVRIGQELPNDWITDRILNIDDRYRTTRGFHIDNFFPFRGGEIHDPLVVISSLFATTNLSEAERTKASNALSNSRSEREQRLWSDADLSTSYVVSDVDIFPTFGIAYTEKYLNVRNTSSFESSTQEAIYSFILPEGAVVTSLSLWIGGKEEKGILTSKGKAATAYNRIVSGRRDPSVVHWQEGNRVQVRVFPCSPTEERKFKIGITSPLLLSDGNWHYDGIPFEGPPSSRAKETLRVSVHGSGKGVLSRTGEINERGDFVFQGDYDPTLTWCGPADHSASSKSFAWNGFTYRVEEAAPLLVRQHFDRLYLDVNQSWSKSDLEAAVTLSEHIPTFVYDGLKFIRVTQGSKELEDLAKRNFTLFPFYEIANPKSSLVVTKGNDRSPHLADLSDSPFATKLTTYFGKGPRVFVFNIGTEASTFVKSLRDLRTLHFAHGTVDELASLIKSETYPTWKEDESTIILHEAGVQIVKQPGELVSEKAPDHLARLFAYNDILRRISYRYFQDNFVDDELIAEASEAYVVSPVSSLIVLESQADYDRYDIAASAKSLGNASKDGEGAVPEPHEWALIILTAVMFIYFWAKRRSIQVAQ